MARTEASIQDGIFKEPKEFIFMDNDAVRKFVAVAEFLYEAALATGIIVFDRTEGKREGVRTTHSFCLGA